jgi:BirA family biotin operon repressor/biotin-[acetyl-CoA-carboxylase] ligase
MDVALEQMALGAPHGTTVVAETQELGKGRLDRRWISPKGGVYLSIILYPPVQYLNSLTMITSLAVCDCIKEVCGLKATIKWPNDVLVGGKKVSGILATSGASPSKGTYAIVGIGINVDMDLKEHTEIAGSSTNLAASSSRKISRQAVLCALLENFEKRYEKAASGESQVGEWSEAMVTLGQKVTVKTGNKTFTGVAESVDNEGNLVLRLANGELKVIPAGDVTLRV